jgi:hypothetical protein
MRSDLARSSLSCAVAGLLASIVLFPDVAHSQYQPLIKPGLCAQGYAPVCGIRKKTLVTYVNACAAQGAKAKLIAADRGCFEGCPPRYSPVCGTNAAGKRQVYGNTCEAEKSGATDIQKDRCLIRRTTSPGSSVGAVP